MVRKRIINVIKNEWRLLLTDLNSTFLVTLMPLLIIGQGLLYAWLISTFAGDTIISHPSFNSVIGKLREMLPALSTLPLVEQLRVLLLSQFNFFLLLIPAMISMNSVTFSIVEEKLSRSLEPLLATPVRTWEVLLGKALAGAIPALVLTWLCGGILVFSLFAIGWANLTCFLVTPAWFMNLFLLTPALAVLSFILGIIGSSRAKDARNAQQYSLFVILPIFGLIAIQVTGLIWFTPLWTFVLFITIVVIDWLVLRLATSLFQRETIITKWQ